jgi:hypothetical protein
MLDRPNWRYPQKSKYKDASHLGFLPSYKDFGRKTSNGFHKIKKGRLYESDGSEASSLERYNPYVNGLDALGHNFRCNVPQKEVGKNKFKSYTSNDVMMKNSTFLSTSIRSVESQANLELAKTIYEKFENSNQVFDRNQGVRMDFKTLETDYDFQSPKVHQKRRNARKKYEINIERSNSLHLNQDLPLIG